MPWVVRYLAKRTFSHMEKRFGDPQGAPQTEREEAGKVSWSTKTRKPKKKGEPVGEYIEFEEIE